MEKNEMDDHICCDCIGNIRNQLPSDVMFATDYLPTYNVLRQSTLPEKEKNYKQLADLWRWIIYQIKSNIALLTCTYSSKNQYHYGDLLIHQVLHQQAEIENFEEVLFQS